MSEIPRLQCMSMFTLKQTVLNALAKICWGKFTLREDINESADLWDLISYRDEVISKVPGILNSLPKISSFTLPPKIIDEIINSVHNLFEGYYEALKWEQKFKVTLPFTTLNPFTSGVYQAENFIDANRHFNDFEWAKTFVADEDQFIQTRFEFACCYCFEEDIISLWNSMKSKKQLPCKGELRCIKLCYNAVVALWVYNLEGKFHILVAADDEFSNCGFYAVGLKKTFMFEYEYAMQYFWNHCSVTEKVKFMSSIHNGDIDNFIFFSTNMSNFIYSILSKEQKLSEIHRAADYGLPFFLWSNLLHSRFYECVLEDILSFSSCVPLEVYGSLLDLLAEDIDEKQLPIHKSIFKRVWHHLTIEQQKSILNMETYLNCNLKKLISIDPTIILR